jgi:hypothetical protein
MGLSTPNRTWFQCFFRLSLFEVPAHCQFPILKPHIIQSYFCTFRLFSHFKLLFLQHLLHFLRNFARNNFFCFLVLCCSVVSMSPDVLFPEILSLRRFLVTGPLSSVGTFGFVTDVLVLGSSAASISAITSFVSDTRRFFFFFFGLHCPGAPNC